MDSDLKSFPFSRPIKVGAVGSLVLAGCCIVYGMLGMALHDQDLPVPILYGILLTGLAMGLIAVGTPGPSLAHHRQTGRYLVPGKGAPLETRWGGWMWIFTAAFGALGFGLVGLAIVGLRAL